MNGVERFRVFYVKKWVDSGVLFCSWKGRGRVELRKDYGFLCVCVVYF